VSLSRDRSLESLEALSCPALVLLPPRTRGPHGEPDDAAKLPLAALLPGLALDALLSVRGLPGNGVLVACVSACEASDSSDLSVRGHEGLLPELVTSVSAATLLTIS
jgi:hypothetical protein